MTGETGIADYLRFVLGESLARWAEAGTDGRGGFIERIGQDGTPDRAAPRRLRVQARQIYVFAEASRLGLIEAHALAADGFAAMAERYWSADGGFIFSCDPEGGAHDPARYAYEQAFVLLAAAALYRLGRNRLVLDWAERTQRFLDERLADPGGGGYFDAPGQDAPRGQNPHMHLFEAYLALFEATGDRAWRRRAEAMLALFCAHFLDPRGAVGEFFTARWQPAPGEAGTLREPGHQFEWAWLLARYRALCPDGQAVPAGAPLGFGLAGGIDPRDGLAFDAIGPDLHPRETSKRLWPQTELLKALLAGLAARPGPARAARIDRVCRTVTARYRSAWGLWHDRLDPSGAPIAAPAPASTLYHLFVAATELHRHRDLLAPA